MTRLDRIATALLIPPIIYWIALALYYVGREGVARSIFNAVPDPGPIIAMLFCPLAAAVLRMIWLRRQSKDGPIFDLFAAGALTLVVMTVLAVLRPS